MRKATLLLAGGILMLAAVPAHAVVVDGTLDGTYGLPIVIQDVQTQFGDATDGVPDFANGSELDVAYGTIDGTNLRLFIGGNLESNFNKLEIFIDCVAGGQNQLTTGNPGNGIDRMSDDGSGNGLKFDAGYEADYWISLTNGDVGGGTHKIFADYADLPTGGGGAGVYLGETTAQNGTLSGGTNLGIEATIDNSNVAGVDGGCGASSGAGVTTGMELSIPLSALGNANGCFDVVVFVNGGSHDFASNQFLAPVPAQCNLGEPRSIDLSQQAGAQFFRVCDNPTNTEPSTWGRVKTMYR